MFWNLKSKHFITICVLSFSKIATQIKPTYVVIRLLGNVIFLKHSSIRVWYNWVEFLSVPEYYKLQSFPFFSFSFAPLSFPIYCFRTQVSYSNILSAYIIWHIQTSYPHTKCHIHIKNILNCHFDLVICCWLFAQSSKVTFKIVLFSQFLVEASWCKYLAGRLFSNLKKWTITFLVVTLLL